MTAGGVQVEVRFYTRAYVRLGELVFRHHFKVVEILSDVMLELPWPRSYNPTVDWKERYADVPQGSGSYQLSFDGSRDSTQVQFQRNFEIGLPVDTFIKYLERKPSRTSKKKCFSNALGYTLVVLRCSKHSGIFILVLAQPKGVITHFDLWNQTPNQDVVWTPLSPSYRH